MKYRVYSLAQVYGGCDYGASTYQNGSCNTTTTGSTSGSTSSGSSGTLTNTGFDLLVIITIACGLIFAGLVIRFWRRSRQHVAVGGVDQPSEDQARQ